MCLTVKEVPWSERQSNFVECWKMLGVSDGMWGWGTFYTPYRWCSIPKTGILIPDNKMGVYDENYRQIKIETVEDILNGYSLEGGFIHAFWNKGSAMGQVIGDPTRTYRKAYAFGVVAYGLHDLACRLLYIPSLDEGLDDKKHIRTAAIERWSARRDRPTNEEVERVFNPATQPKCSYE